MDMETALQCQIRKYQKDAEPPTEKIRRCESPTSRASRLERLRQTNEKRRRHESPTSRAIRLEKQRKITESRRRDESPASRAARLEKDRKKKAERRRGESPTSRASRLEKQRQITEKRRRNESPASRASRLSKERQMTEKGHCDELPTFGATRFIQQCHADEANAHLHSVATVDHSKSTTLESNIKQHIETKSIQEEKYDNVNGALDNILGDKTCNDDGRNNTAEGTNNFSNNDANGIQMEGPIGLSDKEDYSHSILSGGKPFLSHSVSNEPKDSSTYIISNVKEVNSTIQNLCDSNLEMRNKNAFDFDLNSSEAFRKYQCFLCSLNFDKTNDLSNHLVKHFERNRPYMCQVCKKAFPQMNRLKRHINSYADIIQYQCDQCKETFTTSSNLAKHRRYSHSGMTPYKCSECDYKTFIRSHLNRHTAVHMDERPFKCNYCSYASKTQSCLIAHERIHKDDKRYKCDICYACFVEPQQLRDHREKHFLNHLIIHRCRLCPLELGSPHALRNHMHRVHREL